jgi:hypothetical protein
LRSLLYGVSCFTSCYGFNDSDVESLEGKVDVGRNSGKGESSVLWVIYGEATVWPSPEAGSPFPAYTWMQVNSVVISDLVGFSLVNGSPPETVFQSHSPYQRAFFSS